MVEDVVKLPLKQRLTRRVSAMATERESFMSHYQELAQYTQPRRGRFMTTDRNKGNKRHQSIINSAATLALRRATAGMLAGVMSPSRPWFSLATPDPALMEFKPVKIWLQDTENLLRQIFNASNLYNMAPLMITELLLFGTGCMTHMKDFQDVARFYTHTAGSYMLAQDSRYKIDTMAREFEWTVMQVAEEFGLGKMSPWTRSQYDRGNYDVWVPLVHCIYPNDDRRKGSPMAQDKKWASVYYEPGNTDKETVLRKAGFDRFPVYAPRWETTGEDIYGTNCPGMLVLGDTKGLQIEETRKAQAIDKMVSPPLHGPAQLRGHPISSLPGGLNLYDMAGTENSGLRPVYTVNPNISDLKEDILRVERRIQDGFFVDLWLAITNMDGVQPRNEFELSQRNQERLLQVGPVLESLHGEVLDPLINNTFDDCAEAGILPPPPKELEGVELTVQYISSLAQAQRATATGSIERTAAYIGGLVKAGLSDGKKFDADQSVDEFASVNGTPPRMIRSDEEVAQMRQAEAEQAAAAQQAQMAEMQTNSLKNVAGAAQAAGAALKSGREALQPDQQGAA